MRQRPEWLEFLREEFPSGSRVKLRKTKDPDAPLAPGATGTLDHIDDEGTFHVKWDDGQTLGLVFGTDSFTVLPPDPTLIPLKLYMPLTADLYEQNEYGGMEEYPSAQYTGQELVRYADKVLAAIVRQRIPEEMERGMMHWYHGLDAVNDKVRSAVFSAECKNGQLWGTVECQLTEPLTPGELDGLKEFLAGQTSDGFGESLEQRTIDLDRGEELYVHLWNGSDAWSIQTEQERFCTVREEPKLGGMTLA